MEERLRLFVIQTFIKPDAVSFSLLHCFHLYVMSTGKQWNILQRFTWATSRPTVGGISQQIYVGLTNESSQTGWWLAIWSLYVHCVAHVNPNSSPLKSPLWAHRLSLSKSQEGSIWSRWLWPLNETHMKGKYVNSQRNEHQAVEKHLGVCFHCNWAQVLKHYDNMTLNKCATLIHFIIYTWTFAHSVKMKLSAVYPVSCITVFAG